MARYIDADELIEDIKRVYCTDCNNYNEVRCRACGTDDAISVIECAPSADVVHKSEYDALKEMLDATIAGQETLQKALAERVEVVRCKDCKWCTDMGMSGLYCDHPDDRNPIVCLPTDYCNCGERREQT